MKKEVAEQEDFIKFHENLATRDYVIKGRCHLSTVPLAREKLAKHNAQFK